jgi:lipopolysaccharide biosynthesis regulator YciM
MTTSTLTVIEFALARIEADEAKATRASSAVASWPMVANEAARLSADAGWHVLDHNPARVLAQCAAMRKIVEDHRPFRLAQTVCQTCEEKPQIGYEAGVVEWPCPTIRALASIWSDHPDWREEWR